MAIFKNRAMYELILKSDKCEITVFAEFGVSFVQFRFKIFENIRPLLTHILLADRADFGDLLDFLRWKNAVF